MARVAAGGLILQVVIWGFGFLEKSKNLELLSRMAMEKTVSSSVLYLSGSCRYKPFPCFPYRSFSLLKVGYLHLFCGLLGV